MTQPVIGTLQLNSQSDVDANLAIIAHNTYLASKAGVHVLVLPENACRMGNQIELSERFDALSSWYAALASQHNMFIVAGTLPCPYRPDGTPVGGNRVRQVSQVFAPDGRRIARYDKVHLFQAQVADQTGSYDEGRTFEAGDTTVVAQCDIATLLGEPLTFELNNTIHKQHYLSIGMMICFDLRFPALAQRMRQAGADILTAPSAFTYQTGKAHWDLLLKARALDAQCMVIGSAQGGTHYGYKSSRETWGHSAIANANGEIIAATDQTEITDNNLLITAPFNLQQQLQWRSKLPTNRCHRLA